MTHTKILATIGPSSQTDITLAELIKAGMTGVRINFSHGTQESHAAMIHAVRRVARSLGRHVPILQDLSGPKIRIGTFREGSVELLTGMEFTVTSEDIVGDEHQVSTNYRNLPVDVKVGDFLFLDDGNIRLEVEHTDGVRIQCHVMDGGILRDKKGINLVGSSISQPALTEKDRHDLEFGARLNVDYVALSFVRGHEDVEEARMLLTQHRSDAKLIAKIERPEAIRDIGRIIAASDGIMVARGDLGVEMPPEDLPPLQKSLIQRANRQGRLSITATQMLESMMNSRRPSRAEASDIANAVFDGTDVVMLSGETAMGHYPVQAVATMRAIIEKAESQPLWYRTGQHLRGYEDPKSIPYAVAAAATSIVHSMKIRYICCFTMSGKTAQVVSQFRPGESILVFSPDEQVVRQLNLFWGIQAFVCPMMKHIEGMIDYLEHFLLQNAMVDPGDVLLILAGSPVGTGNHTNLMKIHEVSTSV